MLTSADDPDIKCWKRLSTQWHGLPRRGIFIHNTFLNFNRTNFNLSLVACRLFHKINFHWKLTIIGPRLSELKWVF